MATRRRSDSPLPVVVSLRALCSTATTSAGIEKSVGRGKGGAVVEEKEVHPAPHRRHRLLGQPGESVRQRLAALHGAS